MKILKLLTLPLIVIAMAGCASSSGMSKAPYSTSLAPPDATVAVGVEEEYRVGPLDKISIQVFGQPDLSVEKAQVDASGQIVMPLIGPVAAGGKSVKELSAEIAVRLGEKYLRAPSVSVQIDDAVSQRVTVTGAVVESGVYQLKGRTTLLQAISMAKGPDNKSADLKKVAVFRTIDNRRAGAMFDLVKIRKGEAEDPVVYGGDTVVIADSKGQRAWREFVSALPGLGIFAYF